MQQAPTERAIIERCIRERRPLPDAIANAPELWLGLELFFIAFMDLTSTRAMGYGEGPIPWHVVGQWCDEHDIHGEQREDVRYHVSKLDGVYLEHRAKVAKSSASNGPPVVRSKDARHGTRR